ncbi:MAG: TldD/PmbA family protein [Bacillota bacterium]|nr:TldD/PmbA family protein [Bacillota bacterium]NLL26502.1 TldD/PmbA family protein [Erysipelotrichia bacterium]
MISKNLATEVLNIATETGADFAEIYLEEENTASIGVDNGKVESCNDSLTYGAGIRLLKGLQSVYGYTNDLTTKGLKKLAKDLSASFFGEREIELKTIKKVRAGKKHLPKIPYDTYPREKIVKMLKEASEVMKNYDESIVRTTAQFAYSNKKITIFNTDGKQFSDIRCRGRAALVAVASKDGKIETFYRAPGAQKGMEFFLEEVDLNQSAKEVAKSAVTMLSAKECPSGKMPVVIGSGFGGVVFHEACGHSLEASVVSKGLSVFSGKKSEKIASNIVSAVDDATIEGAWGSGNIDDEGNKTRRNVLIKNGILNSYLVDDFNGRRMNEKGNGATRRQSYKYEPTSRMSNTFILPGESTPDEIIADTEFGLYAKSMGGGSVNPATGEFNFAVNEGYLIQDGKITHPVKGATLIGSGKEVLLHVDRVGNDLKREQGMCGASSGMIPADVGQPTIRVSEITVGGTGGDMNNG